MKVLDYFFKVWYNNGRKRIYAESDFRFPDSILISPKIGLTTVLTIYRFGLRGNSAFKSTRKHRFQTKKHQKDAKITQKIGIVLFGTSMPQVRTLSLRPNKHRNYDTKEYRKSGAYFYSKALIYKAFFLFW